jgi:protein arginine N-methyltransferase 1
VTLDISGDRIEPAEERTTSDSWRHAYLPIAEPIPVEPYDRVALAFQRKEGDEGPFAQSYRWSGTVWRGDAVVGRFDHRT